MFAAGTRTPAAAIAFIFQLHVGRPWPLARIHHPLLVLGGVGGYAQRHALWGGSQCLCMGAHWSSALLHRSPLVAHGIVPVRGRLRTGAVRGAWLLHGCGIALVCGSSGRPESLEHGMSCFARLIRALLGHAAVANRKLECGLGLVVLGVEVALSMTGYALRPAKAKALACIELMERALESGVLSPGCAQKLAGRLSWAGQHLFHRVGRAMLRPIFRQRFARRAGTRPPSHVCGAAASACFAGRGGGIGLELRIA